MKKPEEGESLVEWHNKLDSIDRPMFDTWFSNYLTNLANKKPAAVMEPALSLVRPAGN